MSTEKDSFPGGRRACMSCTQAAMLEALGLGEGIRITGIVPSRYEKDRLSIVMEGEGLPADCEATNDGTIRILPEPEQGVVPSTVSFHKETEKLVALRKALREAAIEVLTQTEQFLGRI